MKIGWFGVGSGILSDKGAVGAVAEAAEDLGFESLWVGEHPVLIDPRERPSPLAPHTPLLDPVGGRCPTWPAAPVASTSVPAS